jgi:hypothetical protein
MGLMEFPLEEGGSVWIEAVDVVYDGPVTRGLRPSDVSERASGTFEEALAGIRPGVRALVAQLSDVGNPDHVELTFGIKLSGQLGVIFSSTSADATFGLKLVWNSKNPTDTIQSQVGEVSA